MKNNKKIVSVKQGNEFLYIFEYIKKNNQSLLYVARDDREIFEIQKKIKWLLPSIKISIYRSWNQIPYDNVSPSIDIQSERIQTLYEINNYNNLHIVITSVNALIQKTVDNNFINQNSFNIENNTIIDFENFKTKLNLLGYNRTSVVRDKSEFAIRGSIIDIFLSNRLNPIRIDFIDNKIESIYEFDRLSQKKINIVNERILINSSSELLLTPESINLFRKYFRKIFINYRHSQIYKMISESIIIQGAENYLPLFHKEMSNLFEYCKNFHFIFNSDFKKLASIRLEDLNDFYDARIEQENHYNLKPTYLFLNKKNLDLLLKNNITTYLNDYVFENSYDFKIDNISNLSSIKKEIDFVYIKEFLKINNNFNIIICANSIGSSIRIKKIFLEQLNLNLNVIKNFDDFFESSSIKISILSLNESIKYKNIIFLTEKTIFGYNLATHKPKDINKEIFFEEINKFNKNCILVHSEYGFCRFIDIKKIDINLSPHDCLELEFAENQKLFLPIENLNLINKYGNEDTDAQLDRLGALHWQKRKAKAKNKIKDIAKQLISIAAKRQHSKSYKINFFPEIYEKFCSNFPYIETEDQIKAIEDIKSDFKKDVPADRLIVGDVAFGKTEVILRAVFLASMSKIQSLILVPTTLLSRQHLNTFTKRLKPFGINVSEISRLISPKDKLNTINLLKKGKIEVIIGTHALLSEKINFKKLGLIIYDEEQKLGTKQKEKYKIRAPRAHVISLSATPIPRTLSLSLSGIRDLSLILTAPYERLSVRSYISPFNKNTITEAIKREVYGRKNSVFLVAPRKKDIPFLEKFLNENLPQVNYVTAHGKLNAKILEKKITKFYNKEIPLMISTNIIENGLDLPHVNTIIIYRSNMFSLSGLYQLKGRVGRSSKRGYAYLTFNENEMTDNSRKRLNVINSFDSIGSGFNIAAQDLELRGGGSIIGEEQSGFIKEVGTELYYQMLEEEILNHKNTLENNSQKINISKYQPTIKIPERIFIPDEYIDDIDVKMSIYKRISQINNDEHRNNLMIELIDRFGNLPLEVENLFKIIEIKLLCLKNNIDHIEFGKKGILFSFFENKPKNPDKILNIGFSKNKNISIRNDQKIFYDFHGTLNENRFELIKKIINKIC